MTLDEAILALNGPEDNISGIPNSDPGTSSPSWLGDLFGGIVKGATTLGTAYLSADAAKAQAQTNAQRQIALGTGTAGSNNTLLLIGAALLGVVVLVFA